MKMLLTVTRVFFILLFSGLALAAPPPVQPVIESVMTDFDSNTLTIYGADLRYREDIPEVELLGYDGTIVVDDSLTTSEMIVADLPVDILAGDYRLIVTPTFNPPLYDIYDLTIGAVGPVGPAGADGVDGVDGINGINGTDGVDGINGTDGVDGVDGTDGVDGVDGVNGVNGVTNITYPHVGEDIELDGKEWVIHESFCPEDYFVTGGSCWSGSTGVIARATTLSTILNPMSFKCHYWNTTENWDEVHVVTTAACAAP